MRWICPRCQREVSVALTECPYCPAPAAVVEQPGASSAAPAEPPEAAPPAAPAKPAAVLAAPGPEAPAARPAPAVLEAARIRQAFVARPRRAAVVESEAASPYWRGVKMGIGFMLAVAAILLLLALLLFWLSTQPGWKPWFERLSR